jgi:mannose-6-phosphate isomerase-like protein (cupin superfamily)
MERMPPHTAEQEHFHQYARQFFFILKGQATFYFTEELTEDLPADERPPVSALRPADLRPASNNGEQEEKREQQEPEEQQQKHRHQRVPGEHKIELNPQEGLEIRPGLRHHIENNGEEDLEFILCSQPSTKDDRYPTMNQ